MDRANAAEADWQACVLTAARGYAGKAAAPETIVDAALGDCSAGEDKFRFELRRWSKGSLGRFGKPAGGEDMDRQMNGERAGIRRKALSAVLLARG